MNNLYICITYTINAQTSSSKPKAGLSWYIADPIPFSDRSLFSLFFTIDSI